jgi:hypothetical protein
LGKALYMRHQKRHTAAALGVILCAALFFAQVALATEEVTIVGIVTAEGIKTYDGQVYGVVDNDRGKEVMKLTDRKVEVIGKIMERGDGKKLIEISNYGISE